MPPKPIPSFLLPRGAPTPQIFTKTTRRAFTSTSAAAAKAKSTPDKSRTLAQPDKFRPPSHPARLVNPARTSPSGQPVNYGPRLTAAEREAQKKKQYPNMFPPEGTVMHRFLTNRWIHIWIAMVRTTHVRDYPASTIYLPSPPTYYLDIMFPIQNLYLYLYRDLQC